MTGRYGFAGVLSACYIFGGAVGMPATSVLVDRLGQRRVILPLTAAHVATALTLAILLRADAPNAVLVAPTLALGATYITVGSLVRARWSYVLDGRPELSTALSVESILDELIFVVGPLVATVLATTVEPTLVLYLSLSLIAAGALWLAAQRATEPPPHPRGDAGHESALRTRGMVLLTLATIGMGALFASAEVSFIAFCGQHGQRAMSGPTLAAMAAGSAVSGLIYGARDWRMTLLARFRTQIVVFGVLPGVLVFAVSVPALVACAFVLGMGIAPALITAFGLIQQIVPTRALTEGLTWLSVGLNIGYGVGASAVGAIADHYGARIAFWVVLGSGLLAATLGLATYFRLREPHVGAPEPAAVGVRWDDR